MAGFLFFLIFLSGSKECSVYASASSRWSSKTLHTTIVTVLIERLLENPARMLFMLNQSLQDHFPVYSKSVQKKFSLIFI